MAETAQLISNIISNVGFPIACVLIMFWQNQQERQAHTEETAKLVDAVQKLTVAIETLKTMLGGEKHA